MKIEINDEVLDCFVLQVVNDTITSYKADIKRLKAKALLHPFEIEDLKAAKRNLRAFKVVRDYFSV